MSDRDHYLNETQQHYEKEGLRLDRRLFGGRPLLIPLNDVVSPEMAGMLRNRMLMPVDFGRAETAISLGYVAGKGWIPYRELAFACRQYDEGKEACPVVSLFQVHCHKGDPSRVSNFTLSPAEFDLMKSKYDEWAKTQDAGSIPANDLMCEMGS